MRSMLRLTAMLLVLALMSACGRLPAHRDSAYGENAPETFGAETVSAVSADAAEQTQIAPPEAVQSEEPVPVPVELGENREDKENTAPQESDLIAVDLTEEAVLSALYAAEEGLSYDFGDPVFFWRSMGYLLILSGEKAPGARVEEGVLRIPEADLEIFAKALFGPVEEQYPSLGEENPLVAWESTPEGEYYLVPLRDLSAMSVEMGEMEPMEAGTYRMEARLLEHGEFRAGYEVELEDYPASGDSWHLFDRCITGLRFDPSLT